MNCFATISSLFAGFRGGNFRHLQREAADEAQNYIAPVCVAQVALKLSKNPIKDMVLDTDCGTGQVGRALAMADAEAIDDLDLSPAMLKVAHQAGAYRSLAQVDLKFFPLSQGW